MAQAATDTQRIMGQVTAMAMLDEEFRARLEAAPLDVLREFGMEISSSVEVQIVSDPEDLNEADDAGTVQLYVPDAADLSEEELSMVAGAVASCQSTASSCCTFTCLSCASTASTNSCT
jgi:hypothetical protein